MTNAQTLDLLLFVVLPYASLLLFFAGTILRYLSMPFTYSSLSSQFLENKQHFWGLVSFHYGLLTVLTGHLIGLLIPAQVLWWNTRPLRLYVLEITALAAGLMTLVGLSAALHRRVLLPKMRRVTTTADWVILLLMAVQVVAGVYISIFRPWGSSWYAASAAPYLVSLFTFRPDVSFLATMPFAIKLHIVNAWVIVGVFPFTRLVHALVAPLPYLWRRPEVVRWYGIRMREPGPVTPLAVEQVATLKKAASTVSTRG
jgi:nitrate reductase gamma subunit